jgi:hypothetical protein
MILDAAIFDSVRGFLETLDQQSVNHRDEQSVDTHERSLTPRVTVAIIKMRGGAVW